MKLQQREMVIIYLMTVGVGIVLSASFAVTKEGQNNKIEWSPNSTSNSLCWVNIVPDVPANPMKCPHITCLNSTFTILRGTKLSFGSYYGCGDTFLCSKDGEKMFCEYIKGISPFSVETCEVMCCDGDRCNKPS